MKKIETYQGKSLSEKKKTSITSEYCFLGGDTGLLEERDNWTSKPPVEAVQSSLTVQDVITRLIEDNVVAWKALPLAIRVSLIETPNKFIFINKENLIKVGDLSFNIQYNGVTFRFSSKLSAWVIEDIV